MIYLMKLTALGTAKIAAATAGLGAVNLTQMAVGDGNGNPVAPPTGYETALVREVFRSNINSLAVNRNDASVMLAEMLIPSEIGGFAVHANVDRLTRQQAVVPPEGFAERLAAGFQLRRKTTTNLEEIDAFEQSLVQIELQDALCWFVPWLRGIYQYRQGQFKAAYPHYKNAFELAKYKAGRLQYDLVNQFVEIAAKNGNRKDFDKGIDWACYIGVEIRWLRDKEPTQENRDFVYAIMERANYAHQL